MDIFINGRFLTQKITGVQRFAIELLRGIDDLYENSDLSKDYKVTILAPKFEKINKSMFKHIPIETIGSRQGHLWEQLDLFKFCKGKFLVNLCNTGPILKKDQISVIHDAAVFSNGENFSFLFKMWYKVMLTSQAKFSKKIVTVSNFSKSELVKYLNISSEKIKVIYEGKEHFTRQSTDTDIITKYNLNEKPYLLAVSSLNPNKNFRAIIKALDHVEHHDFNIVIAGGTDPKVFSSKDTELPKTVKHVGYVTDEELKTLYQNAFCFIYPSFYEGFGLPPLEAMSIGCPVIISNRASLPEVGGEAALYCNPDSPEDLAEQIKKVTTDPTLREEMIAKGYEQSAKFTWTKCAQELIDTVATLKI